jgi:3-hydroxyacyl-CoA dehydrogenase/enoyl-CoA hydratase/3-hydroxybutyryl-CoA epimerase
MTKTIEFSIDKNGVANLVFDLKEEKINKLSSEVLFELEKAINVIDGNKAIRVLIISSAKPDIFIAGADIKEIREITNYEDAMKKVSQGQNILNRLAKLKIITISVIRGACLGGGLELALACKYRVAVINPKTIFGLPEVNLGIIPGFGGTQRLPKLIGLQQALEIILSGKSIDTKKAFKIGLVDDLIREEFLEEKLSSFLTDVIQNGENNHFLKSRNKRVKRNFILEKIFLGKFLIFYLAKKNLFEKTKGNYPAPFYALEVIKRTDKIIYSETGLKIELEAFCELATGAISKNLIEIFFTNEELKKDEGIDVKIETKYIKNTSVLGAGIMGGGIAWLFANNNFNVRIKDLTQNAIATGYNQIIKIFNQLKKIRKITQEQINMKIAKVTSDLDYKGFDRIDLVIEAAVENMAVKKNILADLEKHIRSDAIIASNTSSLSISEMSCALQNPDRFIGMHFFNPVNRMPLVEVIRGEKTSNQTIATVVNLAKKLGKTPIVVKDVAGFLVNRILLPYMNEAAYLLQEGGEIERIDNIIERFGMPMGPFVLADVVGIDVGVKVSHSLQNYYGERMKVADILDEIFNNHKNLLGKKSKEGFYLHNSLSEENKINPIIYSIVENLRKQKNIHQSYIQDSEILNRCILTMVNEAAKCLEENVVKNARYLDLAMIMGAGFPAFRGGLLKYADSIGLKEIVLNLRKLNEKCGKRFEVSKLLIEMSENGLKFY